MTRRRTGATGCAPHQATAHPSLYNPKFLLSDDNDRSHSVPSLYASGASPPTLLPNLVANPNGIKPRIASGAFCHAPPSRSAPVGCGTRCSVDPPGCFCWSMINESKSKAGRSCQVRVLSTVARLQSRVVGPSRLGNRVGEHGLPKIARPASPVLRSARSRFGRLDFVERISDRCRYPETVDRQIAPFVFSFQPSFRSAPLEHHVGRVPERLCNATENSLSRWVAENASLIPKSGRRGNRSI